MTEELRALFEQLADMPDVTDATISLGDGTEYRFEHPSVPDGVLYQCRVTQTKVNAV